MSSAVDMAEGHVRICGGPDSNSGMGHVVRASAGNGEMEVAATTLDLLARAYGPPSFVWMDIEGFELNALKGGREVLSRDRPPVFCEVNRAHLERAGGSIEELVALFRELGYRFFDASDWRLGPVDVDAMPVGAYHANWLIVPKVRVELVSDIRPSFFVRRFLLRF